MKRILLIAVTLLAITTSCVGNAEPVLRLSPDPDPNHSGYVPSPEPMYAPQYGNESDHLYGIRYRHWKAKHDEWLIHEKIAHDAFDQSHKKGKVK